MKIVYKLFIAILVECFVQSANGLLNYCQDDSDTYSYKAVISSNLKWSDASERCRNHHKGCLARPNNATTLKKIKKVIIFHSVHGPVYYWVGLKVDHNGTLMWDDDKLVKIDSGIQEIVNFSIVSSGKACLVITKNNTLQPDSKCDETQKFICQIPHTKIVTTRRPETTPKGTTVLTTDNTGGPPIVTRPKTRPKTTPRETTLLITSSDLPSRPTRRPRTVVDQKVDEYVQKANKIKVKDKNSINAMLNMTSSLITDLKKNNKRTKGHVMDAALTMEEFGMKYAKQHLNSSFNTSIMQKREGYVLEMRKVINKQRLEFPPKSQQSNNKGGHTTINLPDALFDGQDHMVVNALFTEFTDYIPLTRDDGKTPKEIISPVISSTLDPKPDSVLKENVTIVLEHFKKSTKFKPVCVYWDISVSNDEGGEWSTRGCTVIQSDEIRTVCSCNHLTSFALLMQVDDTPSTNSEHKKALNYITYIGCAFSLIGEALTVLAYVLLMNMKQEQCQIRVNLAISLAVAQIFFLSGITATSNPGVCTFVGVMLHYFYLVAFGWMMLEGVYLYLMVVKVFNTIIKMKLYYIFAWGSPLVIVSISLIIASTFEGGVNSYTNNNFCWVSFSNGLVWTFIGPVIVILTVNIFILVCAVREIVRLNRSKFDQAETFRQGVKACVVLFPLLGLTWLFGLLSVTDAGIVFQYIFTILNSFQGFLIFILHCLRSGEIRSSFKHKIQRWEITRSTNFASSLAKSGIDNSVSSSNDNNPLKYQYSVTDSVQETFTKNNRVKPVNNEMDDKSVRTCEKPCENRQTDRQSERQTCKYHISTTDQHV